MGIYLHHPRTRSSYQKGGQPGHQSFWDWPRDRLVTSSFSWYGQDDLLRMEAYYRGKCVCLLLYCALVPFENWVNWTE